MQPRAHLIPFQATPVQHGPTPLNFGFGFGSAIGSPSTQFASPSASSQWGQSPQHPQILSPSHRGSPSSRGGATAYLAKKSETKRRRDSDDDDSDDEMGEGREKSASPSISHDRIFSSKQALPKRMRSGIGAVGMINLGDSRSSRGIGTPTDSNLANTSTGTSSSASIDKMDLGKVLSTLDKPSLLTLFSRLLSSSTDPTLRDQIIAHIPSPSLISVEFALEEIEKGIRSAGAHAGEMRAGFAWARLRNPVGDFTATSLGFLPFFVDETKNGGILSSRQESPHISTTYNFLHALTVRTLRIINSLAPTPSTMSTSLFAVELNKPLHLGNSARPSIKMYQELLPSDCLSSSNPNTIVTQLIPSILVQWSRLQETVCKGVNEEGKMFGSEMMRSWILSLEALGWAKAEQDQNVKVEEKAFRIAIDVIRIRLEQEVGWLIGIQPRHNSNNAWKASITSSPLQGISHSSNGRAPSHMEEEEEQL
ncbi:hypothetical protein CBS101457_003156 [Exobasidium rhododendri]|nr:hypothetical protein CBS101457_003156 [Exobasidium rhododendri]